MAQALGLGVKVSVRATVVERAARDPSPGRARARPSLDRLRLDLGKTANDDNVTKIPEAALSCLSHKEELTCICTFLATFQLFFFFLLIISSGSPPWIILATARVNWKHSVTKFKSTG